jgi:predicted HTH transcriptional regulator
MVRKIFISSVQRELSTERKAIVDLVSGNPQLARFFSTFAFEFDVPASDKRTDEVYLAELAVSDLYVGIIGNDYGGLTSDGVSATESEYDEATRLGIPRFIFVKGSSDKMRDPRERNFLRKVSPGLIRVRFKNTEELLAALTESLDRYLAENKVAYAGLTYEEEPVGKWEELDEDKIRWFVRTAREKRGFPFPEDAPVEKVLKHLKMMTDGVPNRAAMLCFGKDAHLYATSPGVKCILWYGKERRKPAGSYKWFEGNLFEVSDKAIEFIKEKLDLRIGGHTLGAQSDDTFEIDEKVVAEMVNNGIAHRDYTSSATVQVELFRDRLTVFSPGPMHRDMRFEMLAEDHQSYATNPIIAHALFYVKYIEEIGSGTVDMFDLCRATGLRPPVFDIDARHFTVTVYRPEFDENGNRIPATGEEVRVKTAEVGVKNPEVKVKGGEVKVKTITNGSEPITNLVEAGPKPQEISPYLEQISPKPDFEIAMKGYRKDLRETCGRIWSCLAANIDLTQREIAVQLQISESSVLSAMNALQEVGLLKREGYGKGRKWIVKFSVEEPEVIG